MNPDWYGGMKTGISLLLPYFQTQELVPIFVNSVDLRAMLYTQKCSTNTQQGCH